MEGQYGSAKAVAATTAQTITWNVSDIPNGGYAALTFLTTGVNNHLGATTPGVSRIRVKDNNMPLIDVGPTAIRTFMEAESPSNTIPVTNQLRWTLMTSLPGFPFRTGIPFGRKTSVEVDFNAANSSAGDIKLGYDMLNLPPEYEFKMLTQQTNVAATATRGHVTLPTAPDELLYGVIFPIVGATGITRAEVVVAGQQVCDLDQGLLLEGSQRTNPGTLTTTFFRRMSEFRPLTAGNSYIKLTTGAGAAVGDEITFITLRDLRVKAA